MPARWRDSGVGPRQKPGAHLGVAASQRRVGAARREEKNPHREPRANRLQASGRAVTLPPMPSPDAARLSFWRPPGGALPAGAWFGVTTRLGGTSVGAFAALNLGLAVGDADARVEENRSRVRAELGLGTHEPFRVHQEHGRRIVLPGEAPCGADGFLVRAGDPWVAVSAADCAPVAVLAADATAGALLHSGWRGAVAGIAVAAVEELGRLGYDPAALRASIGPCLHACCFPIGPDVAALFPKEHLRAHPTGQLALDLPGAIAASLRRAGVPRSAIHVAGECSSCEAGRFYSHRRDRGITGRHWGLLHLPGLPPVP